MEIVELIGSLQRQRGTVLLRKLSKQTLVGDCCADVRILLGLGDADVYGLSRPRPLVGDYPYDIWMCKIGRGKGCYGLSLHDAIEAAMTANTHYTPQSPDNG